VHAIYWPGIEEALLLVGPLHAIHGRQPPVIALRRSLGLRLPRELEVAI
jgi:hypothetical protein